jgi:hypothetical protein
MDGLLIRNWSRIWFSGAIIVSILCLTVTFFAPELREHTGIYPYLRRFHLGGENSLGTWWSGILLLLASVHAFDGFFVYRHRQPSTGHGWASISVILFLLSIDEIGSIHERIDRFLQFGSWLSLLPFALILLAALIYGVLSLWQDSEQRRRVIWILIAFSLLTSVAMQEYLQHHSQWWGEFSSLRLALEEGTELLAILILLKASMSNTEGIFKQPGATGWPVFQSLATFRTPLLVIGALSAPALAYITAALPDQERGHPADWLAAAGFLFAALVIGRRFFESGKNIGWGSWALSVICWIMSAAAVAITPARNPQNKFFLLYFLSLLICVIWIFHAKQNKALYLVPGMIIIVMSALSLIDTSLFLIYLLYPLIALLTYYVNACIDASANRERFETAFENGVEHVMK